MATKTVLYKNKGQIYPVTDASCVIGLAGGETTLKDDVQGIKNRFPVKTVDITDANVTEAKIATDAVTTVKIKDANVTAVKLASNSVTTAKITDANVTEAKIATDAVTTVKIKDSNVTEGKLAANAVTTAKIKDANVTTAKIADSNVTTAKLANSSVTKEKLATDVQSDLGEMKSVLYDQFAKVTLSRNPTVIEKGVATPVTVNFGFTFNDKASTPDTLTLTKNGSSVVTDKTAKTYSDSITDTTSYVLTCKKQYGDTEADAVTKTASVSVTAYYPKYAGGSTKTTLTEADVIALTKQGINGSTGGTYNVTSKDNEYFWICVPSTFGNVTKVTLGGFAVPMAAVQNVTVTGKGSYKCYRSANPLSAGTRAFVVA